MADRLPKLWKNRLDDCEYRWLYPIVMSQFLDERLRRANTAEIRKTQEIAGRKTE